MRTRLAAQCTLFACLLIRWVRCDLPFVNVSDSQTGPASVGDGKVPSNHRMSSEEVPNLNSKQQVNELNETLRKHNASDFPFNVDFVEQPDLFEMGQSFFMPTLKSPLGFQIQEAPKNSEQQPAESRWSRPFEINDTLNRPDTKNMRPETQVSHIMFDDENDESLSSRGKQIGSSTPTNENDASAQLEAEVKLREAKLELDRQVEEQKKLLSLLGRRVEEQLEYGARQLGAPSTVHQVQKHKLKPLVQSGGLIRGIVPSHRVVKHPEPVKYAYTNYTKGNHKPHILKPTARSSDRHDSPLPHLSITGPSASHLVGGQRVKFSGHEFGTNTMEEVPPPPPLPRRTPSYPQFNPEPLKQMHHHKDLYPQHFREETRAHDHDYSKLMGGSSLENSFANMAGASNPTQSKFNKLPQVDLNEEDEDEDAGEPPQLAEHWRDLPSGLDQLAGDINEKQASFSPYSHHLFADNALGSLRIGGHSGLVQVGGGKGQFVPYGPHWTGPYLNTREKVHPHLATKSVRPFMHDGQSSTRLRPHSSPMEYDDEPYYQHRPMHQDHHHRPEGSAPGYLVSPSKKVIHIHTKEKKGHGKYLWPILGGGLTMLIGFLIISNMLLSIPLLAMGASALFGHAGFHTQSLVPVYNLSQLRPPSGRRRKRWASEPESGSSLISLHDPGFKNVFRRLVANLARSNQCKNKFF